MPGRRGTLVAAVVVMAALGGAGLVPVDGGSAEPDVGPPAAKFDPAGVDLSAFPSAPPATPQHLLFIHHSCGGQLFAPAASEKEWARCIYESHPNGGGLRGLLEGAGYKVHEASYGSEIGDKTDLFDWLPKFRDKMDTVLRVSRNDTPLPPGETNAIVVFKSCYTQNEWEGEGRAPGNPAGPTLTVADAQATLRALLPEFQKRPDVLFVYLTSPPLAPEVEPVRLWKFAVRKVLGKPDEKTRLREKGRLARQMAEWVRSPTGWLQGYPLTNVVVFDYYGVLTGGPGANLLRYPTGGGKDSHPAAEGNARAAAEFVPFLNRAWARLQAARAPVPAGGSPAPASDAAPGDPSAAPPSGPP